MSYPRFKFGKDPLGKLSQVLLSETKDTPKTPEQAELELVKQIGLLNDAFKKMTNIKKKHAFAHDDSDFDYIKEHFENYYKDETSRNKIDSYLKAVKSVFTAYKDFDKVLTDLQDIQIYFNKTPNCLDQTFLHKYQTAKAEFQSEKNPRNEKALQQILVECGRYHLFVKEMIRHLETPHASQTALPAQTTPSLRL